jgi:hypothetical protein
MSTYIADNAPSSVSTLDTLAAEIGAMQVIARALGDIHDREGRQRVLSWAHERFTALPPAPAVFATAAKAVVDEDPTLSCEGLEEFFERPRGVAEILALQTLEDFQPAGDAPTRRERRPLDMLMRSINNGLELLLAKLQTV